MKLNLLGLLVFSCLAITGYSQQLLQSTPNRLHPVKSEGRQQMYISKVIADSLATPEKCGFALVMQNAVNNGFDNDAFEAQVSRLIKRKIALGQVSLTGTVTVPIVFHVIYRTADALGTTSANLSAAKFQAQVNQLNIDYANLAGSNKTAAGNVPIRFCMAVVDTAGRIMAEPGIDRINGQTRGYANTNTQSQANLIANFDNTIKPGSIWDPYSYVNVWTASMNTSGLLGYSTFPSFSTLDGLENSESNTTAGVVIAWQSVGSVASPGTSAAYGYGRTLTHELGHFFGLRHIWGDATCGNDYCDDTPPQSAETSGCPTTDTLNNCVPSMRKMYENYMDYSNDACLNTFTNDQSLRSQVVMDNSPRRISLITSQACQARAANAVSFATSVPQVVAETGTGGCPNTKSYTFRLYVSSAATAAATVTFNMGGTAVLGKDYTISPSSVSYTSGDNAAKVVTITVIDDQVAEPDETLTLSYNISGAGVTNGPDKQIINMTITDDDIPDVITIDNSSPLKNILTQNFDTTTTAAIPTGWTTEAYIASATASNQWTVGTSGGTGTTGKAAYITNNITTKPNTYTNTNTTDAYLFTPLLDASALRDLNITFKWRCAGESGYDAGYIGYVPEGLAPTAANVTFFTNTFNGQTATATAATANLNLPTSLSGKKFYFVFNWYNDETDGTSPGFTVDDIVLTGKAYSIATTTDADTTFPHYNGQTVTYYSKSTTPISNRIIAKITGMNTDAGCITASIPAAGTGRTLVTTGSGTFYRTNKVIKLTPAVAVPSASYQVTLYYTVAEMAVWGSQISSLKMLKLSDATPLAGPYPTDAGVLVTPTFVDNSATGGYYSFTGSFSGGFSQFMLVAPDFVLPVTLTNFTATPQAKAISLQWSTLSETNNKGFNIERSTDATNFSSIGWIAGKGTTTNQTDYNYVDQHVQPGILYYYRLRQTDIDGKEKISEIKQASILDANIAVAIQPILAKDFVQVSITGTGLPANISLITTQGQVAKSWQNVSSSTNRLDISNLPSGIYILKVNVATQQTIKKIVIER